MYIICVCLFSALSRMVGALQISIIIKVEVAVLGSPSLIARSVSVDVKQHSAEKTSLGLAVSEHISQQCQYPRALTSQEVLAETSATVQWITS